MKNINQIIFLFFSIIMIGCNGKEKSFNKIGSSMNSPENTEEIIPKEMSGILKSHNKYRAELNLPKLKWSNKLSKSAKNWAIEIKKNGCIMRHSKTSLGENIAWNSGFTELPEIVVDRWASEKECFDFKKKKCNGGCKDCLHYTQIVWRSTEKCGCAVVECGNKQIWVCHYEPAGNKYLIFNGDTIQYPPY